MPTTACEFYAPLAAASISWARTLRHRQRQHASCASARIPAWSCAAVRNHFFPACSASRALDRRFGRFIQSRAFLHCTTSTEQADQLKRMLANGELRRWATSACTLHSLPRLADRALRCFEDRAELPTASRRPCETGTPPCLARTCGKSIPMTIKTYSSRGNTAVPEVYGTRGSARVGQQADQTPLKTWPPPAASVARCSDGPEMRQVLTAQFQAAFSDDLRVAAFSSTGPVSPGAVRACSRRGGRAEHALFTGQTWLVSKQAAAPWCFPG